MFEIAAGMPRRAASAIIAAVVAASFAAPAAAWADDAQQRIVQWHYMESEGAPDPDAELEDAQGVWRLVDVDVEPDPAFDGELQRVDVEKTETRECRPADLDATLAAMPESVDVEQDGVSGAIPRTSLDSSPVWLDEEYQVDRVATYDGLPTNDADQIPASRVFFIEESGNTLELRLAGLEWTQQGAGDDGMPSSWSASALYRGTDTRYTLDHYIVTATYAGGIGEEEPADTAMLQTAVYELAPETEPAPEPEPAIPWQALAAGGAAAAVVAGGALVWWRSRDVKVVVRSGDGKYKVVGRVRTRTRAKGSREAVIPSRIDLAANRCLLVLRPDVASTPRFVAKHLGQTVYDGPGLATVDLGCGSVGNHVEQRRESDGS